MRRFLAGFYKCFYVHFVFSRAILLRQRSYICFISALALSRNSFNSAILASSSGVAWSRQVMPEPLCRDLRVSDQTARYNYSAVGKFLRFCLLPVQSFGPQRNGGGFLARHKMRKTKQAQPHKRLKSR